MGWFDEQIKERKLNDDELFSQAFVDLTGAVLGKQYVSKFRDGNVLTKDAIDEILKFYHIKSRDIPGTIKELPDQLEYLLQPHGIMRRVVNLEKGWYKDAFGAMLCRLKDSDSVVALIPTGFSGYTYLDPKSGKRITVNRKTEKLLDDEAIVFYNAFPQRKMGLNDILSFMMSQISTADIIGIIIMTFVVTFVGMFVPGIVSVLTGEVIASSSMKLLFAAGFCYICVTISSLLFTICKNLLVGRISTKISVSVEAATLMRILSLPADFFKDYSAGELNTYMSQVSQLSTGIIQAVFSFGFTSLFSLIYVGQVFRYAPSLVKPSLVIILFTVLFSVAGALISMKHSRKSIKSSAKENGLSYSLITGIQKIKLAGAEKRAFAKWAKASAESAEITFNPPKLVLVNPVLLVMTSSIGTIALYYISLKSGVSVSEYYAFSMAYGMTLGAFTTMTAMAMTVAQIKPFLDSARPIFDAEPEISEGKHMVTRLSGGIEIDNVSFRYKESMPYVLENVSLKIKSGEYIAIVGETGCGKSTLIRLLLGFEKPKVGAIYYDGKNIDTLDLKSLRKKIGVVTQNGKLFQGDIFSNIVISAPELTLPDAWEAAELAGIADDIQNMPMGMNTIVSEGQGGISGGQRQRLMIARAIAPKPKILIFDEATSALDNITQKKVSESLDSLKCTRIVVAHRLSTIRQCDRIIMLGKGHILEQGTYDELIAKGGAFAELVERQRID